MWKKYRKREFVWSIIYYIFFVFQKDRVSVVTIISNDDDDEPVKQRQQQQQLDVKSTSCLDLQNRLFRRDKNSKGSTTDKTLR